jgi:DNA repair protein RadD
VEPRPYQIDAERRVIAYAATHPTGRLLLVIPTRGGKTFVGARLVQRMALRHGLRALWLAHREELLDEAVRHLVEVGIHHGSIGVIKAGRSSDPTAKVQVASDATLDRRRRPEAHIVVTDEAHRDTAARRRRVRRAYPKAFLLGLTATPKPPPTRDLGEDYDSLMVVVQPSELIHDGYLSVPTIYAPATRGRAELPWRSGRERGLPCGRPATSPRAP